MNKMITAGALALALASTAFTTSSTWAAGAKDSAFIQYKSNANLHTSDWVGAPVKNSSNETIGDVNDFVLDQNGKVVAVVTGVGGFLGLGEKNVAIDFGAVTLSMGENSEKTAMVDLTKEALQAAPEYKVPGSKTMRDRAKDASKAASQTYKSAKETVKEGVDAASKKAKETYEATKEAVTGDDKSKNTAQ
ncbi:MAG: PRC-barrel domain-containing protein [Alphaproteobacteria bacterium]|nr:PRC-barrel domain-containing protein [Alphaproteobacteria bacterium]